MMPCFVFSARYTAGLELRGMGIGDRVLFSVKHAMDFNAKASSSYKMDGWMRYR